VNLAKGKIGEAPAMLFGGLLVTMLGLSGLARADTPQDKRRDFFIYLDEFQTFTTLALVNMLAELRKYRLGFVLANQYLEQIEPEVRSAILGNAGTLLVFRVGAADAASLVKELLPDLEPYDLTLLPNRMFWIRPLVGGESKEAFTGRTISLERKSNGGRVVPRPRASRDFKPEDLGG